MNKALFLATLICIHFQTIWAGCCSLKYKQCDATWCGDTKEKCLSCGNSGLYWLESGALTSTCSARWEGCASSTCCPGLTCRVSGGNWMQCLSDVDEPVVSNPTPTAATPTSPPTNKPTARPTARPISSPTARPTAAPTSPPTTRPTIRPTARPTLSPTPRPSLRPTVAPTTPRPTSAPVASPTAKPTSSPVASPTPAPVAPTAPTSSGTTVGKATYYGGNVAGNACGFIDLPTATFPYGYSAAAGGDVFDDGYGCGSCYQITCTGPNGYNPSCYCDGTTPTVTVQVTDQCPECGDTHFDLNTKAFEYVVGDGLAGTCGVINTLWKRVSCPVTSNIRIRSKSGTSQWWYGLHVDYVAGYGDLSSVRLRRGGRTNFDVQCDKSGGSTFWLCNFSASDPLVLPVDVQLTDSGGRTLYGYGVITSFDGGAQFDFGSNFQAI